MKRSIRYSLVTALAVAAGTAAGPAFAQPAEDAAGAAIGIGIIACWGCAAVVALAAFVWWVFMVIDVIKRQEWEFPGSTGSSKTMWLLILLLGGLIFGLFAVVAAVYYFVIYRKGPKAGTTGAQGGGFAPAPPAPPAPMAPPEDAD